MKTWNLFPLHCHSWFPPKNGAQQNLAQKRFERFFWCNGSISFTELSLFVEGKVSSKEPDVSRSLVTHSIPILYFRASYEKSLISTSHSWWYILSLDFHSNETLTFIPQFIHHPQGPSYSSTFNHAIETCHEPCQSLKDKTVGLDNGIFGWKGAQSDLQTFL